MPSVTAVPGASGLPQVNWAFFRERLMNWYQPERRPMPWKEEKNPYYIWLSEIILQQTRVEQGLSYFEKFRDAYPTVQNLAKAPDEEVMKLWEGLGYYSRARNLLKAARLVTDELGGELPKTARELQKLPGVGPYTAAAIASFAFNEAIPVLDGNVYRVLSRFAGEATPIDTTSGKHRFNDLSNQAFDASQPARYNQAIMDFGALVCKPKQAACGGCPLNNGCVAFAGNLVQDLPVKSKKIKKKTRYFHYMVVRDQAGRFLIQQRVEADIWRDLFQFPLIETPDAQDSVAALITEHPTPINLTYFKIQRSYPPRKQQLTHQTIIGHFHEGVVDGSLDLPDTFKWVTEEQLSNQAFPKLITSFIADKSVFLDLFSTKNP